MNKTSRMADQNARDRIVMDLGRNVLVEAGAGSGKTHEMARRMAAGIATGLYQVEHMSAVTFTRKAAAELRGRFQLALEDELSKSKRFPDAFERIARIRRALSNLERFFAGTIHSFCAHLLRERPVEAGVSPGFTELDETDDALLRKQSWRDFFNAAKTAGDPTVTELSEAGIKPKDLDSGFETVCLYEEVDFPTGTAARPDTATYLQALDQFWTAICKKLPKPIPEETTCKTQKVARRFYRQLRVAEGRRSKPDILPGLIAAWDFEPGITQKWWADDPKAKKKIAGEITSLHTSFRVDIIRPYLAAWRQYVYRLGISLLTKARAHAEVDRRRNNTLNYGDLLQLAARLLREKAEVRHSLQEKYQWLFVDEFQDTDPVQAEIIFLLAGDDSSLKSATTSVDWRSIPLRRGALFIVGDPKQSIYRFRRADIDIYSIVRDRLSDRRSGQLLSLTTNFRSVPSLCKWANTAFRQQFPAEPNAYSPKFAPLEPHRTEGPSSGTKAVAASGVYTLTISAGVEREDVPFVEAEQIARFIRSEVDAQRRSFGDFLVLTRKRKQLTTYVKALEMLHIPLEVSGAGAFSDSEEVGHLALLLRALSDPQDTVSLIGVLRGPLFGISDQDLFAYRRNGGWLSISAGAPSQLSSSSVGSRDEDQTCQRALACLSQMFRWTRVLPPASAIERILEHTGYLALAATTPGGVEAGDLLHAIDRVRQVVAKGHNLAAAASALEDDHDASSELESLPLEPGRSDVIRVMNIHQAKGLEAPVVFLADPCGGVKQRADVRIIRDGSGVRGYFSLTNKVGFKENVLAEPSGWHELEGQELNYIAAEEIRLLYVSATRARDLLVIGKWAKPNGGGVRPWEAFVPFLTKAPELPIPVSVSVPPVQPVDLSPTAFTQAAETRRAAHERACTPSWSVTSVTSEARQSARRIQLQESLEDPIPVITVDTPSHQADAGLAWGTLIHGLLEHSMRHQNVTREDLRRLAIWLTLQEPQLRPAIDEAVETVEAITHTEFWEEAKNSEHHVEVPFCNRTLNSTGVIVLTNGVVDLVYGTDNGWRLIDYKTDQILVPSTKYAEQLSSYRDIWQKMTKSDVRAELVSAKGSTRRE